jgi:hypothetical protein
MTRITSLEALDRLYGTPNDASTVKVTRHVTAHYRTLIEASPFVALATSGPEGLDCSPRGELGGAVRIADHRTLLMPDRRGNNRVDSLRNIVRDPRVGLLFLIPGSGTTLRVNGRAHLDTAPALLESFAVDGKEPRCVIVITIEEIYFQCARAIVRSALWDPAHHVGPASLPTPGAILAALSEGTVGGEPYDREWPARAKASLW